MSVTQLGCANGVMFMAKCLTKDKYRRDGDVGVW